MIESSSFKRGDNIVYKGEPMTIVDVQFSTPSARGATMMIKTRLRHLRTGQVLNENIRSGERFDEVDLDQRPCTFLYADATDWHFMDSETFEQFTRTKEDLGEAIYYLHDGIEGLRAFFIDGHIASLALPNTVTLEVTECDPAIKGATATSVQKPAVTATGLRLLVPPYLAQGEKILVDTRDGHFVSRA